MSGVPALSCQQLTVGYGDMAVAGPMTWELFPGEVLAVVGSNGSGKSTLLRTLVRQLPALSGSILLEGQEPDERTASFRASVAQVFDDDVFFPSLTVREHLSVVAAGHAVADVVDSVEAALDEFGLNDVAEHFPHAVSSGQRRRLLLAAAFVRPHSVLILDEPEQRLDTAMRSRLKRLLCDDAEQGGAIIMAAHDPRLIAQVANRAVIIGPDGCHLTSAGDAANYLKR